MARFYIVDDISFKSMHKAMLHVLNNRYKYPITKPPCIYVLETSKGCGLYRMPYRFASDRVFGAKKATEIATYKLNSDLLQYELKHKYNNLQRIYKLPIWSEEVQ